MRSDQGQADNPINRALSTYRQVITYRVTLRSASRGSSETIRYYFKSGDIRMEFISPFHGAVLIYNPAGDEVYLKPFGMSDFVLKLGPDNALVRSAAGHRPDESDIGSLLKVVAGLQSGGTTHIADGEIIGGRRALLVRVTAGENVTISGIHEYALWLDTETYLPLKMVAYGLSGECMEEILMDDLETNIDLPDNLFRLP